MSKTQSMAQTARPFASENVFAPLYRRFLSALLDRMRFGRLAITLPEGGVLTGHGLEGLDVQAGIRLRSYRAVRRMVIGGDIGFAESYVDGDWDSPDLANLLFVAARNQSALEREISGTMASRFWNRFKHLSRFNSRRGSRRNIAAHYDLGNDFYAAWLDDSMTYSSAWFEYDSQVLVGAQRAKYVRLCEAAGIGPGDHVLEIGCGWGGFAEVAALEYGCRVTAVTVSEEQRRYAAARIASAGLADRVEIRLQDYRDIQGTFDAVVSVEMFEAVGESYWPTFVEALRDRLKPGARAALQIITIDDARFESYRRGADFIQRHVFPGGMLPSPTVLRRTMEAGGLRWVSAEMFGESYARTLAQWHERFLDAWPRIAPMGFDARFRRLWTYYLAYCEAGFRAGAVDVGHFTVVRP